MKNSVLAVPGILLGISILIGQSYSTAFHRVNADDSNDGATSAVKSSGFELSRDMSNPINARFARGINDRERGDPSPSSKFNYLILIIPCVLGVVLIIFITVVVCYQMRKSGRNRCISNEWLIWCGLKKREHASDPPDVGLQIDRSGYEGYRPVVYVTENGVVETRLYVPPAASPPHQNGDESALTLLPRCQGIRSSEWEMVRPSGASPSERSPTRQDTPTTNVTPLPTDDEEVSPQTEAIVHHCETDLTFMYPDPPESEGSKTPEQIKRGLKNIPDNDDISNGLNVQPGVVDVGCSGNGQGGLDDNVFNDEADKQNDRDIGSEEAGDSGGQCNPGRKRKEAFVSSRDSSVESNHSQAGGKISGGGIGEISSSGYDSEDAAPQPPSTHIHSGKLHMNGDASDTGSQDTTRSPRSAPPTDTHREIHVRDVANLVVNGVVRFEIQTVDNLQVGDREINHNHHFHHPCQAVPKHAYEVHGSFNRDSPERHTR